MTFSLIVITFTFGVSYAEAQNFSPIPSGAYQKEKFTEIRFDRAGQIEYIKELAHTKRQLMRLEVEEQLQEQALVQPTETAEATRIAPKPAPKTMPVPEEPTPVVLETPTPEPTEAVVEPTPSETSGAWYDAGPAASYDPAYDNGGWERIYWLQASWGNQAPGATGPSTEGYHCVHADIDLVGVPIVLSANGVTITCITADTVQDEHKWQWRQDWAIELSWTAFVALGLNDNNYVEVYLP
jgi:hypothetical protein